MKWHVKLIQLVMAEPEFKEGGSCIDPLLCQAGAGPL